MSNDNNIDYMIKLEMRLSSLYKYFSEIFPDESSFWDQLVQEELDHASILENYKKFLPPGLKIIDKAIIIQIVEDIEKRMEKFKNSPPTLQEAVNLGYLLEKNAGESHYQAILEKNASEETVRVFQTLNFADKDHARRIQEYHIGK